MGSRAQAAGGALLGLLIFAAGPSVAGCSQDSVSLRGDWGAARFGVEVADEPQERSRGLMFVEEMAQSRGMLFTYDAPHRASFWMKNTLIPLDMLFADASGVVTRIHRDARPHDTTPIDGGPGVAAVLEINGGLAERYGITEGSEMRHPSFGADAAWPCAGG